MTFIFWARVKFKKEGDCILDNNVVRRGRGRPRKEESYDRRIRFLGDEEHNYMLKTLENDLEKSAGEILRDALEMMYKMEVEWRD